MNKVIPVLSAMGGSEFPLDRAMYKYPRPGMVRYSFGFAVVKTDDDIILVDTGVYSDDEFAAADSPIFKQLTVMMDNKPVMESLAELDIRAEDVTKIILTHLHWDHAWNVDKFPNAKIYVQKKEIEGAVTPLPYERIHFGYWDGAYATPNFLKVVHKMIPIDGDREIVPGVRVMFAPGHTRGGQIVFVDTADGTVAIMGDFANLPMALTEDDGYAPGLVTNVEAWYEAFERFKLQKVDHVLSFHDSTVYGKVFG